MTTRFFLDNLWRWKCELPEMDWIVLPDTERSYNNIGLVSSQWSKEFEDCVRECFGFYETVYDDWLLWFFAHACNRMVQGAFRYGIVGTKRSRSHNHLSSIEKRYQNFFVTYNVETLLDIYNLYMLQWLDTGKADVDLIACAVACIRQYIVNHSRLIFVSVDDGIHSEKL
jgi:hypothetical protein